MTRAELLKLLIGQARSNGFEFKRWFTRRLGLPWEGMPEAIETLSHQRRYYALLFEHEFAGSFWKGGTLMTVQVAAQSFPRLGADGELRTVERKGYLRRRTRNDAWRFHLREMAVSEEPLRYMRKFLRVAEDLEEPAGDPERSIVIVDEEDLLPDDEE